VGDLGIAQIYTVVLSGFTLATFLFLKYGILHYSLRRDGFTIAQVWKAFASHIGLEWIFSASWVRCIFNSDSPFVRTNKFLTRAVPGLIRTTMAELSLGVGLLAAALIFALNGFILAPIAALVMCLARLAIYWVWSQTLHTFQSTADLFAEEDASEEVAASELNRAA
jgi:hypothetical protein